MPISFKYKIMFKPTTNNIFKLKNYFETFNCSVYVSKNDDNRNVNAKSLLGWLSIGPMQFDTIVLYFTDNVNIQNIKRYLDMIEI